MTEPGVDDDDVDFNRTIKELDQVREFLTHGQKLVETLFDTAAEGEPPADIVNNARLMIKVIRQGLQEDDPVRRGVTDLRDRLVAGVYAAAKNVRVEDLADDAGFGTAYVSRVAHRFGVKPRIRRRRSRTSQQR